ncbi:exodeoxyribonuclease V subunit gamma [Streptomyces thermoviolaceus]|uniref:UvrD-helicase domain-containing protein n=1 Tax=Streptomyces thermoviolaceus TaxID=1952 RepID=UPI001679CC9E|nr:UvrD-helicase domain-containing protein [Streptomyces thermoviolaceus]MCM3266181.1 exodeoxyribonuclease V subunit gamma [Streptomyces thermoviolaceus]WTD46594.1 exodeoxyribonuclease V subunit gamma [Streptomyces thermoviolaceus]GGV77012.1 DNA helicase [Streptomyces thermoviolaceus subsp. apingens]
MPKLAFDIGFFTELPKLQPPVRKGVLDAWDKFDRLTLDQLFKDPGLKLESLENARDKQIRTIRVDRFWRGVVLAPPSGDTFVLLRVMQHDKAIAWAKKQKSSVNQVTRTVEIRDAATLEEITPAYERAAEASPRERLFAKFSDGDLKALGIDDETLRQARSLVDKEQLEVFAPLLPQDQREVLEFLAEGYSVEEVWQEIVAPALHSSPQPVDPQDYDTAIQHSRARIAVVTASEELQDILEKPFAAWRIFLHPSQRKVAYRPSYAGPAQVTGGPGTGKTVVALHRVKHLLGYLRDGDRILLTTYTNALVDALRAGLDMLVDDPDLRARVDISTVDGFASRVISEIPGAKGLRPLTQSEEESRWAKAAQRTGFTGSPQFLAQEYRHVVLAQDIRTQAEYAAAERRGRGSRLSASERPLVWRTVEQFTADLAAEGARTWLQTCVEAARLLEEKGPRYRHVVVDEAQDLHPAQWRLLRAAVPARPDDLFIAGDPHQRIYDSKVSLKSLGIKVTGRSVKLRKNYRSTQEILRWSTALLLGRPIAQLEDENRNDTLLGYRSALRGEGPTVHAAANEEAELDALVSQVRAWMDAGVGTGEIGVSARFNKTCAKAVSRLTAAGIPAAPLRSADAAADTAAVRVGTMHSFKGLEFRCVAVVGVNDGALPFPKAVTSAELDAKQHETDMMAERCLLFVACTRARDSLYVSYAGKPSPFLVEAGV